MAILGIDGVKQFYDTDTGDWEDAAAERGLALLIDKYIARETVVEGKVEEIFSSCCERWSDLDEFKSCLEGMGGKLVVGKRANKVLTNGKPGHSVCWLRKLTGSPWIDCKFPVAVVLPEEVAFKIIALGYVP